MTNMNRHKHSKQAGFTLVEILIAALILSVGLLGIAGMQARGLQFNQSAYERSQATIMAYDIADRMRNNVLAANAGAYDTVIGGPAALGTDCEADNCVPADMAAFDLFQWKCSLDNQNACGNIDGILNDGDGSINVAGSVVTIIVQWTDDRGAEQVADRTTSVTVETIL